MGEPATRRISWGLVLALASVAVVLLLVLRRGSDQEQPAPWASVLAAVLAGGAAFLVGRWRYNYAWGLVLALLLTLHPLFLHWAWINSQPLFAEALQLVVFAVILAAWRQVFLDSCDWLSWTLLLAVLCLASGLAWLTEPRAGLVIAVFSGLGLFLAALLGLVLRRRKQSSSLPPSRWNLALAGAGGVLTPVLGLLLAPALADLVEVLAGPLNPPAGDAAAILRTAVTPRDGVYRLAGFTSAELATWCWPNPWVVLPLMAYGLWRSCWRGRKQWRTRRPPVAWLVPLYTGADLTGIFLRPDSVTDIDCLPLATLSVLLAVVCMADVVRGVTESLVLQPPHEREETETA